MASYRPIIGLEIHVEMRSESKMFCGCPAAHFGVTPNTQVCPVCFGLPGALPVANEECIKRTIKIGLALGCEVARESKFDRKNYFYPDLPKGYQISQYDQPLCYGGQIETENGAVGITRVHLEEDTAKLQHVTLTPAQMTAAGVTHADVSLLDFNRSGVGLVEIVTEPDIHSGAQARDMAKNLVQILRYLDVSDCDMEKGSLRLEANISVQSPDEQAAQKLPAYKVEVKNLNSFRFLERAINYEIERHIKLREQGELPVQETRGWNDGRGQTYSQRSKEEAEDYRYFPDPDLPALRFSEADIAAIARTLPEMPLARRARFMSQFGLSAQNATVLTDSPVVAAVAEQWLVPPANNTNTTITAQQVANAVVNKKITTWLLDETALTSNDPASIAPEAQRVWQAARELYAVTSVDATQLAQVIDQVLADPQHAAAVASYKAGKLTVLGYLMGQVMRQLATKAEPTQVRAALEQALGTPDAA